MFGKYVAVGFKKFIVDIEPKLSKKSSSQLEHFGLNYPCPKRW
jgi:hypothetical protein